VGRVFGGDAVVAAVLDRLLDGATVTQAASLTSPWGTTSSATFDEQIR